MKKITVFVFAATLSLLFSVTASFTSAAAESDIFVNPALLSYESVVFDSSGNLYVLSSSSSEILKYSPDGTLIDGDLVSDLVSPLFLAIDSQDNLYVLNSSGTSVTKHDSDGVLLDDDFLPSLILAESMAFDANDKLFAADLERGIIMSSDPVSDSSGDISDVVDVVEFDTTKAASVDVIPVDADTFLTAYQGAGSDGFVATYNVTDDAVSAVIDTLEFDTTKAASPSVTQVDSDTFAVSWINTDSDVSVATFDVSADGTISDAVSASATFDLAGKNPDIVQVDSDTIAISYTNSTDNTGHLITFDVTADGATISDVVDSAIFDATRGLNSDVIPVGNSFAIAYSGDGSDGFVSTFGIASNGTIGDSAIDSLEFDTRNGKTPDIQYVASDVYAIAYSGSGSDGFVSTVSISTNGTISDGVIDTLEFDTTKAANPVITNAYSDVYAIAYSGDDNDGFLSTLTIDAAGSISDGIIDTTEFDATHGVAPVFASVDANTITVAYTGDGGDGYAVALDVSIDETVDDIIPPTFAVSGKFVDYATTVEFDGDYTAGVIQNIIDVSATDGGAIGGDTVDTSMPGDYSVTYTVTDNSDNANSATITETVTVEKSPRCQTYADAVMPGDQLPADLSTVEGCMLWFDYEFEDVYCSRDGGHDCPAEIVDWSVTGKVIPLNSDQIKVTFQYWGAGDGIWQTLEFLPNKDGTFDTSFQHYNTDDNISLRAWYGAKAPNDANVDYLGRVR